MWVTQTYLGTVEPDANLFIYYFFEDSSPEQRSFTDHVQFELEKMGEAFGDKVSLLMPNPRYAGRVEAEVREYPDLWWSLHGQLPGLFVSRKPLVKLSETSDSAVYIPFKGRDPQSVAEVIQNVRGLANRALAWDHQNPGESRPVSALSKIFDALELKPGVWGFRIDLKKLTSTH